MEKVPLHVSVIGEPGFRAALDLESLREQIESPLEDLALPAEIRIEVRESTADKSRDVLFFDGRPCPHPRLSPEDTPARQLAQEVQANLDVLLTPSIVEDRWRTWSGASDPCPDEFAALLRRLARYRLRPDRIAKYVPRWKEADPEAIFEEALSEASRRIVIELHPATHADLSLELAPDGEMMTMMIDGLFYELGVHTGECLPKASEYVRRNEARMRINDVHTSPEPLFAGDECLVNDTVERLKLLSVEGRKAINPANGNECAIISSKFKDICQSAGLTTWNQAGYLILVLSAAIRNSASMMVSLESVEFYLNKLETAFPVLTQLMSERLGVTRLAHVLRSLLEEEISIRDLPGILENLLTIPPTTPASMDKYIIFTSTWGCIRPPLPLGVTSGDTSAIEMAECVRMQQKRYISHKYTRGQNTLIVYLMDPKFEERLSDPRPLTETELRKLLDAVSTEVGSMPPTAQNPVVLTTALIRYRLRKALRGAFPRLSVLSYQELSPDMNIQPIARISLEEDD